MKKYSLSDNKIIDNNNNNNNVIATYINNKVELLDKRFSYNKIYNIFKFTDIPTQRQELRELFINEEKDLNENVKKLPSVLRDRIIFGDSYPTYLRADSNEELKREVDIWYNVMYLNKDQNGNDLRTAEEIKRVKNRLLKRVGHISDWDVSRVTDMSDLFSEMELFNDNINNWNVSNVTNMSSMFFATNFNRPLDNWDVSNVTNMSSMFFFAENFNRSLKHWDVSSVTNMGLVFVSLQ